MAFTIFTLCPIWTLTENISFAENEPKTIITIVFPVFRIKRVQTFNKDNFNRIPIKNLEKFIDRLTDYFYL